MKHLSTRRIAKRFLAVLLCLCSLFSFSCSLAPNRSENDGYTFTDDDGNVITLQKKPERVAVLFSSYAEIWTLAGGTVSITVGEAVERGFADDSSVLVDGGAGKSIHTEELLAARPDFVIGSCDIRAQAEACSLLRSLGIPAAVFRVDTFQEYANMMQICCHITGCQENYTRHVTEVEAEISATLASVPAKSSPLRILLIRCGSSAASTKAKTSADHFVCVMLQELGTVNIADNAPILTDTLSMEEILRENPDYIFFSTMGDADAARAYMTQLLETELWQSLDAVKNNRYTFLPKEMFQFKPNHRWGAAYQYLAEILYHAET